MDIFQCNFKVYLLNNIFKEEIQEILSKLIDKSFYENPNMKSFHEQNKIKKYSFNQLYPMEKDGIYKEGSLYNFQIRCIGEELKDHFIKYLTNGYTSKMKILTSRSIKIAKKPIEKIYSISSLIIKIADDDKIQYWRNNHSEEDFFDYIRKSCIKKYEVLTGEILDKELRLFNYERIDNIKPIATKFKDKRFLGDKVTLNIETSEAAQNISYMLLGTGVADMAPRGYGFVNYQYIK
jgi:CRISPR-associated endoribonuclease Cas6